MIKVIKLTIYNHYKYNISQIMIIKKEEYQEENNKKEIKKQIKD